MVESRCELLRKKIDAAARGGVLIHDEVLYTELCDKLDIVRELPDLGLSRQMKERLVKFRDRLAHANELADTAERALSTCKAVQDALALRTSLASRSGVDQGTESTDGSY